MKSHFKNIFSKNVKPNLEQRYLDASIKAGWQMLRRGDRFDPTTTEEAVVICIAVWSHPDVEALESFGSKSATFKSRVFVFSLHDLTFEEIIHFMPGIQPFTQTPVVAKYCEGKLVQTIVGHAARDWMEGEVK